MYVQRNIEERIIVVVENITYSECEFVAVVIQRAMRMFHIAICNLPGSTIFSHITL